MLSKLYGSKRARTKVSIFLIMIVSVLIVAGSVLAAISGITVTAPNGNEDWSGTQDITWDSVDCVSGVDYVDIKYASGSSPKGIKYSFGCESGSFSWDTSSLPDGSNYEVIVYNSADYGVSGVSDNFFTIDNTDPTAGISNVATDWTKSDTIDIICSDTGGSDCIDTKKYYFDVDGICSSDKADYTESTTDASITVSTSNNNYFCLWVEDNAGNSDTEVSTQLKVDTNKPTITSISPEDGTYTNDNTPTISANVADALSGISSYTMTIDGTVVTSTLENGILSYTPTGALGETSIPVVITITDNAGNLETSTTSFTVDTTVPEITDFNFPVADAVYTTDVALTFTATDTNIGICSYTINGGSSTSIDCSGGTISVDKLIDGRNEIVLTATDLAGNTVSASSVSFVYNNNQELTVASSGADFATIQVAINAASSGDTINVAAGTYTEVIIINKPLTLLGATYNVNKNGYTVPAEYAWDDTVESIINHPSPGTGHSAVAIVDIDDVSHVTFKGFVVQELNAVGNVDDSLVRVRAQTQEISNIVVENNIIGPFTNVVNQDGTHGRMGLYIVNNPYSDKYGIVDSSFSGNKIFDTKGNGNNVFIWSSYYSYGAAGPASMSGTVIENNEIYGSHRTSVETAGGFSNLIIRNNTIYSNGLDTDDSTDLKYGHGILLVRGASDASTVPAGFGPKNLTIQGNEIYGNQKSGIYMGPINKDYIITGNKIYNNGMDGIRVDLESHFKNPDFEAVDRVGFFGKSENIVANNNNIYNNAGYGVQVIGTPTNGSKLNATFNYWGSSNGPSGEGTGSGDAVSTYVDFTPWAWNTGMEVDITAPTTSISSPAESSWQSDNFTITFSDADTGGSELELCKWRVSNYAGDSWRVTKNLGNRDCSQPVTAIVLGDHCEDEGTDTCKIDAYAIDIAGNEGTEVSRTFSIDWTAPIDGSVSYTNGYETTTTATITLNEGSDDASGVSSVQLYKKEATLTDYVCGDYGNWATEGTQDVGDITEDITTTSGKCYMFKYESTNLAGLTETFTSTSVLKVDSTTPTAVITYSDSVVKEGNSLTITATFSEDMADSPKPKIAISGSNTVEAIGMAKTDTTHYYYTHTVETGDGTATVALSVGTDLAGNEVDSTPTDGATFIVDNTKPTLSSVNIVSDNTDTKFAKVGDVVTITFISSETISTPTVKIDSNDTDSVTNDGNTWTAIRTMQFGDTEGEVSFTIDFSDVLINAGIQVTSTDDSSSVIYDETAPTTTDDYSAKHDVWQNSDQTITLTQNCDVAGCAWTKYCLTQSCDPSSGTTYNGAITISDEGTNYFRYASQDKAGNLQDTIERIVKIDSIEPTMDSAKTKTTTTIEVTFSEDVSNVVVGDFSVAENSVTGAVESTAGIITLTLGTEIATDATPNVIYTKGSLTDVVGNSVATTTVTPTDGIVPTMDSAKAKTKTTTTIEVTFSEDLDNLVVGDFSVAENSVTGAVESTAGIITLTLGTSIETYANPNVIYTKGSLTDTVSNFVASTTVTPSDGIVPTMDSAKTKTTTTIEVTFSEDLDNLVVGDFSIDGNAVDSVSLSNNIVTLTLSTALGVDAIPTVTYTQNSLADAVGNLVATTTVTATDGILPTDAIALSATPTTIYAGGSTTSKIIVTLTAAGNNVEDGTAVTMSTSEGWLDKLSATSVDGNVEFTLTPGSSSGTATITVKSYDVSETIDITLSAGSFGMIKLTTDAASIPADGGTASNIMAQMADSNGNDIASIGETISFETTIGKFSNGLKNIEVETSIKGEAGVSLVVEEGTYGTATVTSTKGLVSKTIDIELTSPTFNNQVNLIGNKWNLISVPKELVSDKVEVVFDSTDKVYYYDSDTESWSFKYSTEGYLTNVNPLKGYWVKPTTTKTLSLTYKQVGDIPPLPPSQSLIAGWNLIGHGSVITMSVGDALSAISGKYAFVLQYNPNTEAWQTYSVSGIKEFTTMKPGYGYWIFMKEPGIYAVGA